MDFKKLNEQMNSICSRCLLPRKEHQWERDEDGDWSLTTTDKGSALREVHGTDTVYCPKFEPGRPLAGDSLLSVLVLELIAVMDGVGQLIHDLSADSELDFQYSDFLTAWEELGLHAELERTIPLRERALSMLTGNNAVKQAETLPESAKAAADSLVAGFYERIEGKQVDDAVYECAMWAAELVRLQLHWAINKDPDTLGMVLLGLSRTRGEIMEMCGRLEPETAPRKRRG